MTGEMQGYSANFCVGPVGQGRAPVPINSSLQRFRTTSPVKLRRQEQELLVRQDEAASSRPQKVRAPRTWRTRKDPFKGLWCDALAWLREEPDASAVALLGRLQSDHPDRFSRARLRITQRQAPMDRHHGKQVGLRRFL